MPRGNVVDWQRKRWGDAVWLHLRAEIDAAPFPCDPRTLCNFLKRKGIPIAAVVSLIARWEDDALHFDAAAKLWRKGPPPADAAQLGSGNARPRQLGALGGASLALDRALSGRSGVFV